MVNEAASFFGCQIDYGGKVLASGDCNSSSGGAAEDGGLGTGIVDKIIGQIKKIEKLTTGLVNEPASFCSYGIDAT